MLSICPTFIVQLVLAMSSTLISIVVPVFNVQDELNRCVESLLNQTHRNIEVILVDDGSTDACPSLCDAYGKTDSRVNVIHKANNGLSSARNAGLREAMGEWILYVDSDDYIESNACERLLAIAESCDCEIVASDAVRVFGGGREHMQHRSLKDGKCYSARDFIMKTVKACEWYAPACFNMYKRTFLISNNLYFYEGILHEDMEMQPRVFLAASRIAYCACPFYRYVDRSTSIMNSSKIEMRASSMELIYSDWKRRFDSVEDSDLRKILDGHLAKCYLHSCCELGQVLDVPEVGKGFLLASALNPKELAKALLFSVAPIVYLRLGGNH